MAVPNIFTDHIRAEATEVNDNFAYEDAKETGWTPLASATYNGANSILSAAYAVIGNIGDKFKLNQPVPLSNYFPFQDKEDAKANATVANIGTPTYTAGKFSNALTLNGSNQALSITDATNFKPTGPFSIGMWFKTSNTGAYKGLFQSFAANTNWAGFTVQVTDTNKLQVLIGNNTAATVPLSGNTVVTDGAWHYIVFSYQSNFGKIFLDGNLEASGFMSNPVYAATNYIRIGCGNNSGSNINYFNGQIDDLFFINNFAVDQYWVKAQYLLTAAQGIADITHTSKYYVKGIDKSTNIITLDGGVDYALYNGAISLPYFSKDQQALDFPEVFNCSNVVTPGAGTITTITTVLSKFKMIGREVKMWKDFTITAYGSASGTMQIAAPITPAGAGLSMLMGREAGATGYVRLGQLDLSSGIITIYDYMGGNAPWTNGHRQILQGSYFV